MQEMGETMKAMNRVLLMAALAALTFFLFAAPAAAFDTGFNGTDTSLSEEMCEDIGQTDFDTADGWSEYNAIGFNDEECEHLCKLVKRTCDKALDNREKCFKKQDSNQYRAEKMLCNFIEDKEERRSCKNTVEARKKENREEINAAVVLGEGDCEDLERGCLVDCPGIMFEEK